MTLGARKGHTAELRHRIVVKQRTKTENEDTGQPTETFVTRFAKEPAGYKDLSGGEFLRGRKIDASAKALFTVNYRDGYETTDVIEFRGQTWGIVSIDIPDGVERYIEIQAKVAQ